MMSCIETVHKDLSKELAPVKMRDETNTGTAKGGLPAPAGAGKEHPMMFLNRQIDFLKGPVNGRWESVGDTLETENHQVIMPPSS